MSSAGNVFNIQRFSIHDGPGIRTTVFLKGCNLRCAWCHNPESISPLRQLQFFSARCSFCRRCESVCQANVHSFELGTHNIDRSKCTLCGQCVENCFYDALAIAGKVMSADEVLAEVVKDVSYFKNSGGGLTLSGGEPLLQKEFAASILSGAKHAGISTALDTAANVPYEVLEELMDLTDIVLLDLKCMNDKLHREYTGAHNTLILQNAQKLLDSGKRVHIRIPLIHGVNTSLENFENVSQLLVGYENVEIVKLLSYHNLGLEKAASLGLQGCAFEVESEQNVRAFEALLKRNGLNVQTD